MLDMVAVFSFSRFISINSSQRSSSPPPSMRMGRKLALVFGQQYSFAEAIYRWSQQTLTRTAELSGHKLRTLVTLPLQLFFTFCCSRSCSLCLDIVYSAINIWLMSPCTKLKATLSFSPSTYFPSLCPSIAAAF